MDDYPTAKQSTRGRGGTEISIFTIGANFHSPRLERICKELPSQEAGRLLIAFLRDLMPEWGQELVRIEPVQEGELIREDVEERLQPSSRLPKRLQSAMEDLKQRSLESNRVADLIVQLHRVLEKGS